jgi:hypothetical protein
MVSGATHNAKQIQAYISNETVIHSPLDIHQTLMFDRLSSLASSNCFIAMSRWVIFSVYKAQVGVQA